MPNIGPLEVVILLAIVLLVFGGRWLPSAGRSLGGGIRSLRQSVTGRHDKVSDRALEVMDRDRKSGDS
jgi:sec-independent protein translocase protein TatA